MGERRHGDGLAGERRQLARGREGRGGGEREKCGETNDCTYREEERVSFHYYSLSDPRPSVGCAHVTHNTPLPLFGLHPIPDTQVCTQLALSLSRHFAMRFNTRVRVLS